MIIKILSSGLNELAAGHKLRHLWIALATEDIFDQHRRTFFGPLWLLINYLAFAGTFIFIFNSGPFAPNYAMYVAVGLLVWTCISDSVTQAVTLFQREESFIKGTTLPLSVYIMRLTLKNIIRASYAALGCAAILLLIGTTPTLVWLWALPGALVVLLILPAIITVVAFLGVFFPDSQFIVTNLMRVAMFASPVFWIHGGEGGIRGAFYHWNPFTYILDMVRDPIVDGTLPMQAMGFSFFLGVTLWALALLLLGSYRRQVAVII